MSSLNEHVERWRTHEQPRRQVDYSRPGFVRPVDPPCCRSHHFEGCADGAPGCCPRCPINPHPEEPTDG